MTSLIRSTTLKNGLLLNARRMYTTGSNRHDNDPEKIEKGKQSVLEKQKQGKGHWHEEIASDAEAFVKAQRNEIDASGEAIQKLQEQTKNLPKGDSK